MTASHAWKLGDKGTHTGESSGNSSSSVPSTSVATPCRTGSSTNTSGTSMLRHGSRVALPPPLSSVRPTLRWTALELGRCRMNAHDYASGGRRIPRRNQRMQNALVKLSGDDGDLAVGSR